MATFSSFAPTTWDAAERRGLSVSMKYMAQRFAELMDPATHFSAAPSSRLDPSSAIIEARRVAFSHYRSGQPRRSLTVHIIGHAISALDNCAELATWFPIEV